MEDAFKKTWSSDQEEILRRISYNSGLMSNHHRTEYYTLVGQLKWFRIPIIIVSSINSVFSVGLNAYITQEVVSVLTCLLSLIVSCIGSVELYLGLQRNPTMNSYRIGVFTLLRCESTPHSNWRSRIGIKKATLFSQRSSQNTVLCSKVVTPMEYRQTDSFP